MRCRQPAGGRLAAQEGVLKVIVATHNAHKLIEIRQIIGEGIELVSLADIGFTEDVPETGDTFLANALQKARFVHQRVGGIVISDDSGLEVDALDGKPGVHSKRFTVRATAEANNERLLELLSGTTNRTARFRCVIAVVGPRGEAVADGTCEGTIGTYPRGEHGFGYDPLFLPTETPGRTMAELAPAEKNAVSHRGRALARLPELLRQAADE